MENVTVYNDFGHSPCPPCLYSAAHEGGEGVSMQGTDTLPIPTMDMSKTAGAGKW